MFTVNNTWMMVSTFLVFIMHLGFATVESGLNRAKNAVNILFKNTMIPAVGLLTYALIGFNLMCPGDGNWILGRILGFGGFGIHTHASGLTSAYNPGYTYWTYFLFQGMFAATAATVVSGAVCERIKVKSFLVFSSLYVAIIYPWVGSWKGGWLAERDGFPRLCRLDSCSLCWRLGGACRRDHGWAVAWQIYKWWRVSDHGGTAFRWLS